MNDMWSLHHLLECTFHNALRREKNEELIITKWLWDNWTCQLKLYGLHAILFFGSHISINCESSPLSLPSLKLSFQLLVAAGKASCSTGKAAPKNLGKTIFRAHSPPKLQSLHRRPTYVVIVTIAILQTPRRSYFICSILCFVDITTGPKWLALKPNAPPSLPVLRPTRTHSWSLNPTLAWGDEA